MQKIMAERVSDDPGRPIAHQPPRLDLQTRRTGILSWPSDRHPTIRILSTRDQPEPSDRHQTVAGEMLPRFNLSRIRLIQRPAHILPSHSHLSPHQSVRRRRPQAERWRHGRSLPRDDPDAQLRFKRMLRRTERMANSMERFLPRFV